MKALVGIMTLGLMVAPAMGDFYGWEDGTGTILGSFGNLGSATNVASPVLSGTRALELTESPIGGTPQAYVAFVEGLTDGDTIDASFWGWDNTVGSSPSMRIWAHYGVSGDVNSYNGSASGSFTYTGTLGEPNIGDWWQVSHQWTFDSALGTRDALIIEARLYSQSVGAPDPNYFWMDDLTVTTSSATATINLAPEPTTLGLLVLGGLAAVRRRR